MAVTLADATIAGNTGSVDPGLPAGATDGDLLLLSVNSTGYRGAMAPPTGGAWTAIGDVACNTGVHAAHTQHAVWWAWYDSDINTVVPSHSGDVIVTSITAWRGVDPTTPLDATPVNATHEAGTDNPSLSPSITTATDNSMIVALVALGDPSTTSGWANANLESCLEAVWTSTVAGGDAAGGVGYGILASAGASGTTGVTLSSARHSSNWTVALRPQPVPAPSGAASLHDDALKAWILENVSEGYTSLELVGMLNELNGTECIGYAAARQTWLDAQS